MDHLTIFVVSDSPSDPRLWGRISGTPGTTGYLERRVGALRPGAHGVAVVAPQSDQGRATHGRRYECCLRH